MWFVCGVRFHPVGSDYYGYNLMEETTRGDHTASDLRDKICAMLGGWAAEEVVLGDVSKGAWQDLRMATQMAGSMI